VLAFADESSRTGNGGIYLIALVMVPSHRTVELRGILRSMLPTGQRRFHWRSDNRRLRGAMLDAIRVAGVHCAVFVKKPMKGTNQRRGRALCLEAALWHVTSIGIAELVIESRGEQDQDDRRTAVAAQRAGNADPELRYSFARPLEEPLLWLPDAIAGAASACELEPDGVFADAVARLPIYRGTVR